MSSKTPRSTVLAAVLSSIMTGAAFAATGLAFASAAHAAAPDASVEVPRDVAHVVVRYDRQTLETNAGVRVLYRRIVLAAEQVCPNTGGDPHGWSTAVRACRAESIARAVRSIDNARLAALYQANQKGG
ncbi:MAG TPA: UrcA family protein [Steroidobacteraceae bacterium]|nr:UrcA family protein [Steroidobacteraceae bacterium]